MEYYASIRKDEYPSFVSTWTGLEEIMLSEISQAERVNYQMVSFTCGAQGILEGEMNHERLWTLKNSLRVLKGQGVGGWVSLVVGIRGGSDCMEHWVWYINNDFWHTEKKFFFLRFYLFDRERSQAGREAGAERERQTTH